MSQENVEAVRAIYEEWGKGNFRAGGELLDPHVLFILSPDSPDAGTYLGTDDVARCTRGFLEAWENLVLTAEEFIEAGDSVVIAIRQRGEGRASGVATDRLHYGVWTFRGRKVIRLEHFRDRADALEAVGLRE